MTSVAERVARAVADDLKAHASDLDVAGITQVVITVKLDAAGCPRSVERLTEARRPVERPWPTRT